MEEKSEHITDEMVIAEWRTMLASFNDIIEDRPPIEKVRAELEELMEMCKISARLTPRQREGIYDRCKSYLDGTYGKGLSHVK